MRKHPTTVIWYFPNPLTSLYGDNFLRGLRGSTSCIFAFWGAGKHGHFSIEHGGVQSEWLPDAARGLAMLHRPGI